jgi:hypothetical protein
MVEAQRLEKEFAMCPHEGFYTCVGRYDRSALSLVYVMVCDTCNEDVERVSEQEYRPHYVPLPGDGPLSVTTSATAA